MYRNSEIREIELGAKDAIIHRKVEKKATGQWGFACNPAGGLENPDCDGAQEFAREHPDRQEVRIVAGVTRHGASYCAVRLRAHDEDASVMGGADLVPSLLILLRATLDDESEESEETP